jgi:hypothetical protein
VNKQDIFSKHTKPVVIGGVGGSGTRLIAQCLKKAGFHIGTDLNDANDNLWFTLLFKRIEILSSSEEEFDALVEILLNAMIGDRNFTRQQIELIEALASEDREQHSAFWLRQRAKSLLFDKQGIKEKEKWGWKEPNSHVVLNRLIDRIGNMKYIHVARNGLDMAHSKNQNQLKLWGRYFLNEEFNITPYYSLKYWCIVHKQVIRMGESLKDNFLFLNYDHLIVNPKKVIKELLDFLGEESKSLTSQLVALVKRPESMERFREHGIEIFAEKDIAFVKSLGFDVNGS